MKDGACLECDSQYTVKLLQICGYLAGNLYFVPNGGGHLAINGNMFGAVELFQPYILFVAAPLTCNIQWNRLILSLGIILRIQVNDLCH